MSTIKEAVKNTTLPNVEKVEFGIYKVRTQAGFTKACKDYLNDAYSETSLKGWELCDFSD